MNVPQLRFDEFDGEWEKVLFKDIFFEKTKRTNDMDQYPLFSLTVEKGVTPKTDRYERSFLVKEGNDNYKIVNPYDFVYNPMNLTLGAVAKHKKNINISVSGYYNVFSTNPKFNSDFLEMYLKSYKMILHYKAIATGSLIEKQRVHFSQFIKIKRPIPSLEEQNKIGDFFALIDRRIEKQQEKIEKLKQFKKGMMQKIFSQELRFKEEDGGEFPEWSSLQFGDVVEKLIGGGTPSRQIEEYYGGSIPWVTVKDLKAHKYVSDAMEYITELGLENSSSKIVDPGDLIIPTRMAVGRVLIATEKVAINQDLKGCKLKSDYDTEFIYYLYFSKSVTIERLGSGSTVTGINIDQLMKIKIQVPALAEQKRIADYLGKLDKKLEKEKEKLMVLEEQKKGLMQGLFI